MESIEKYIDKESDPSSLSSCDILAERKYATEDDRMNLALLNLVKREGKRPILDACLEADTAFSILSSGKSNNVDSTEEIIRWLTIRADLLSLMGSPLIPIELALLSDDEGWRNDYFINHATEVLKAQEKIEEWQRLLETYRQLVARMVTFWQAIQPPQP